MKRKLYFGVCHHFDLMWRRPFRSRFVDDGRQFLSYSDIERNYILGQMELAEKHPDYKFQIESPAVAKNFLEQNPEQRERFDNLLNSGRMTVGGAGYCILDANLAGGETIIRNYLLEKRWRKAEKIPENVLAIRTDSFGNPAQLPQILRGFGYRWVNGLSYIGTDKDYWRGLDQTVVCTAALPDGGYLSSTVKYAPCPTCCGFGQVDGKTCPTCSGTCVDQQRAAAYPADLHLKPEVETDAFITVAGEEVFPSERTYALIRQAGEAYDVRISTPDDLYPLFRDKVEAVDSPELPPKDVLEGELNPVCTGCYVSQIQSKQKARYFENQLLANETLAAMAKLTGTEVDSDTELWENVMYMFFHDAVTGTHINSARQELRDYWDRTEEGLQQQRKKLLAALKTGEDGFTIVNPAGVNRTETVWVSLPEEPVSCRVVAGSAQVQVMEDCRDEGRTRLLVKNLAPYDAVTFVPVYGQASRKNRDTDLNGEVQIENERFFIRADAHGLTEIFDRKLGHAISAEGDLRPLEYIYTADPGSPWATLHGNQEVYRLSPFTALTGCEKTEAYERLSFTVAGLPIEKAGCFDSLCIRYTVTLHLGMERIDMSADVDWDEYENRLRVVLPLSFTGRHMYEVPFGVMNRKPYTPTYNWTGANGDYPVTNWAGVETETQSVALLNRGTPSYRILDEDGGSSIAVSLLRSPCIPTYLQEEAFYTMRGWDAIRDAGQHHFDLAVTAYDKPFADSTVVQDADSYNAALICAPGTLQLPELPVLESGNVHITSLKTAEDGNGLVLRLAESGGRVCDAVLRLPNRFSTCTKTRMDEELLEQLPVQKGNVQVRLRPFEAATFRIQ